MWTWTLWEMKPFKFHHDNIPIISLVLVFVLGLYKIGNCVYTVAKLFLGSFSVGIIKFIENVIWGYYELHENNLQILMILISTKSISWIIDMKACAIKTCKGGKNRLVCNASFICHGSVSVLYAFSWIENSNWVPVERNYTDTNRLCALESYILPWLNSSKLILILNRVWARERRESIN
jgi:hypothetical protein